jgi:uncharacterized membrane protein
MEYVIGLFSYDIFFQSYISSVSGIITNIKINFLKIWKSIINNIFRNNTMIRILAIELLNRNLILIILMIKSLLKKLMVCLDNFSACSVCRELNKVGNRCLNGMHLHIVGYLTMLSVPILYSVG